MQGAIRTGERSEATRDMSNLKDNEGFHSLAITSGSCKSDRGIAVPMHKRTPLLSLYFSLLGCGEPGRTIDQGAILLSPSILGQPLPPLRKKRIINDEDGQLISHLCPGILVSHTCSVSPVLPGTPVPET